MVIFGTQSSITLDVSANSMDSFYSGYLILISFNNIGQLTSVKEYSGLSKRCTLNDPITFVLNSSFQYELFPPVHVISVVPGQVDPHKIFTACYLKDPLLLFLAGSSCGTEKSGIASTSFLFLIILRDSYSNALTSGISSERLSIKVTRQSLTSGNVEITTSFSDYWCSEPSLVTAEQCIYTTPIFQCNEEPHMFSTGSCGGVCPENCSLSNYIGRAWHQSDGSILAKYSGLLVFYLEHSRESICRRLCKSLFSCFSF